MKLCARNCILVFYHDRKSVMFKALYVMSYSEEKTCFKSQNKFVNFLEKNASKLTIAISLSTR